MFTNAMRFTRGSRLEEAWHVSRNAQLIEAMRAQAAEIRAATLNQFGVEVYDDLVQKSVAAPGETGYQQPVRRQKIAPQAGRLAVMV